MNPFQKVKKKEENDSSNTNNGSVPNTEGEKHRPKEGDNLEFSATGM